MKKLYFGICMLIAVAVYAASPAPHTKTVGSTTFVQSLLASTAPTKLYAVTGYNSGPAQFIMIIQTNIAPASGMVGLFSFPIAASNYFSIDLSYYGADLDAVSIGNSTTAQTYTAGSVNCSFQAILAN